VRSAWNKAKDNPQLLMHKLLTNAYKFAWLLIPLSVPFVALTFLWRRRFGLYDHTVFTTYSITFMFALIALATLAGYFVSGWLAFAVLLYAPVHMYRQLRGATTCAGSARSGGCRAEHVRVVGDHHLRRDDDGDVRG
jgi:hypothetical protein